MGKTDEIEYLKNKARLDNTSMEEVILYHKNKPWCDPARARYLMDIAQILTLLPPPPAKLLDLGVGPGWTSKIFALSGYTVLGTDIAPDMVALARDTCAGIDNLEFAVADFENFMLGEFDCAVVYESLHHADNPEKTVESIYKNLKEGGVVITVEPGRGHEEGCREIIQRYGTTEKDMEPALQRRFMRSAGFSRIQQYIRLSALPLFDTTCSSKEQEKYFHGTLFNIKNLGLSCVLVAEKSSSPQQFPPSPLLSHTGLSEDEGWGRWTDGDQASMTITLPEFLHGKSLHINLPLVSVFGEQRVLPSLNGRTLPELRLDKPQTLTFLATEEATATGSITLVFDLPDAKSPNSLGMSLDSRMLAIGFKELIVESGQVHLKEVYKLEA